MPAGTGMIGRQVTMLLGSPGTAIAGVQTKGATVNNTRIEVGDDQAEGWTEALAAPGEKSVTIPISGILKDTSLLQSAFANSLVFNLSITYVDGSEIVGDFFLDSFTETGEYNGAKTFDASFSSSGEVTFSAGT